MGLQVARTNLQAIGVGMDPFWCVHAALPAEGLHWPSSLRCLMPQHVSTAAYEHSWLWHAECLQAATDRRLPYLAKSLTALLAGGKACQPATYRCRPRSPYYQGSCLLCLGCFPTAHQWLPSKASFVQIINNTVIDAIYVPQTFIPTITVYAGSPNPNATSPVNTNVQVDGNLVIRGAVSAMFSHFGLEV